MLPNDHFLLGYIVLKSTSRPTLPILPQTTRHVGNGSIYFRASKYAKFFSPQRGREYDFYSTGGFSEENELQVLMQSLSQVDEDSLEGTLSSRLSFAMGQVKTNNTVSVTVQKTPHTMVCISASALQCYLYGLVNENSELLVVTNIEPESFEAQVRFNKESRYFIYRFRNFLNGVAVLFPKRVSARWSRWSNDPEMGSLQKFAALEKLMNLPTQVQNSL